MALLDGITRVPRPFEPDRGAEVSGALPVSGVAAELVAGVGGTSPHLANLLTREASWLGEALEGEAGVVVDGIVAEAAGADAAGLRRAKRRLALALALLDLGGIWPVPRVTGALTRFADAAVERALGLALLAERSKGRIPEEATVSVFAMGKMGAFELNYSSDIDLVCLFDDSRLGSDAAEIQPALVRAVKAMTRTLSDTTADGYVFRTDLRLRPDPGSTPVCVSMSAAERYYEAEGRTWERGAWIKGRAAAGDMTAGEEFLGALRPFVWRRYLDYAAIDDVHRMRERIRGHKRLGGNIRVEGHDVKLGRGGIREIEFFAQTHQLIWGGRDDGLRHRGTLDALEALAAAGRIPEAAARALSSKYLRLREVEHRIQMLNDAQTHEIPKGEGLDRLAALDGAADTRSFSADIAALAEEVAAELEPFFAPSEPDSSREATPEEAAAIERWGRYPALRSPRAAEIFRRLRPKILDRLGKASEPAEALAVFDRFLRGLPAGVQLFSLFEANPSLVDLIIEICAVAPGLATYLSRNARVLDSFLGGSFFEDWPGRAALEESLSGAMAAQPDYESVLNEARRWHSEWHFRIGVHHLRGIVSADEAAEQYADLAEATVNSALSAVTAEFSRKHGPPPGRGMAVLAMGALGGGSLSAASDLDLILVYDDEGVETSEGPRPLPPGAYYARLTKALITALEAPMPNGFLYEIDTRLRPSGRQGPVATSLEAFSGYHGESAWTWEHLALTRARVIAGPPGLADALERARRGVIGTERDPDRILGDVGDMRARLSREMPGEGRWDMKAGTGRLRDIELAAQTFALLTGSCVRTTGDQIAAGERAGLVGADGAEALAAAHALLRRVRMAVRLLTDRYVDADELGEGARDFILRTASEPEVEHLILRVAEVSERAGSVIDEVFGECDARDTA